MRINYDENWDFDETNQAFISIDTGDGDVFELTTQDLADMLSFAHAEKVKKDQEYKKMSETAQSLFEI